MSNLSDRLCAINDKESDEAKKIGLEIVLVSDLITDYRNDKKKRLQQFIENKVIPAAMDDFKQQVYTVDKTDEEYRLVREESEIPFFGFGLMDKFETKEQATLFLLICISEIMEKFSDLEIEELNDEIR